MDDELQNRLEYSAKSSKLYRLILRFCRENEIYFATFSDFWFEDKKTGNILLKYDSKTKLMVVSPEYKEELHGNFEAEITSHR